jgi:hypothetical protein
MNCDETAAGFRLGLARLSEAGGCWSYKIPSLCTTKRTICFSENPNQCISSLSIYVCLPVLILPLFYSIHVTSHQVKVVRSLLAQLWCGHKKNMSDQVRLSPSDKQNYSYREATAMVKLKTLQVILPPQQQHNIWKRQLTQNAISTALAW